MQKMLLVLFVAAGLAGAHGGEKVKPTPSARPSKADTVIAPSPPSEKTLSAEEEKDIRQTAQTLGEFNIYDVRHDFLDGNLTAGPVNPNARAIYQDELAKNPENRYGQRFFIHWAGRPTKTLRELVLRIDLRGINGQQPTRKTVTLSFDGFRGGRKRTTYDFTGADFKAFGQLTAWQVTLLADDQVVARKRSFLWE